MEERAVSIVAICVLILFYAFVSFLDIKIHFIPVWLWLLPISIVLLTIVDDNSTFFTVFGTRALFGGAFFAFGFVLCLIKNMGGADALMMLTIGFAFGAVGIYMIMFGFVCAIPVALFAKHKAVDKEEISYPLLPSLTMGIVIALVVIRAMGISTSLISI